MSTILIGGEVLSVLKCGYAKSMKRFKKFVFEYDQEMAKIQLWIKELQSASSAKLRVLDVGCGYGRHLSWLTKGGYDVLGVEVMQPVIDDIRAKGLPCVSLEELKRNHGSHQPYDLIILSHIIEHFYPEDLLALLNFYGRLLKPGGRMLIATPLDCNYFWDDFDHVKPYNPVGILMVCGPTNKQIQYEAELSLELEKLWYRKKYFYLHHLAGRRVRNWATRWINLMDFISAFIFRLSGGTIGKTISWVGLYRKT